VELHADSSVWWVAEQPCVLRDVEVLSWGNRVWIAWPAGWWGNG
jgi:hypothetical protein